jgi:hypothetical protein
MILAIKCCGMRQFSIQRLCIRGISIKGNEGYSDQKTLRERKADIYTTEPKRQKEIDNKDKIMHWQRTSRQSIAKNTK